MQPEAQYVLQAAARRAYGADSHVKYRLAKQLLNSMTDPNDPSTAGPFSLDESASICHVPAIALLAVLRSDSCFRVKQSRSSGGYSIGLNAAALLQEGRKSTKAGILVEELPEPDGWVDETHPIRPGRPSCYHWEHYGRCAFGTMCVYNHTEEMRGTLKKQSRSRQQSPSLQGFPDSQTQTGPQHSKRSSKSSNSKAASSWESAAGFSDSQFESAAAAAAAAAFEDSEVDALAAVLAPYGPGAAGHHPQQQQQQQMPAAVPAGSVAQRPRSGGPSRPGAPPCRMLQVRGFCPQGERCPFDHPTSTSNQQSASGTPADGGPAAQQQQQQQRSGSAASSRSQSPLPQHLQQQQQQQRLSADWEDDVNQQQQGGRQKKQLKRQFPSLGVNEHGYPMYKGAPNCPFYMGTGRCDFNERCKYHHPAHVMVPEMVLQGAMSCKFDASKSTPYSRLVLHLQRLWDYECCEEAQLKVWLAHHLLARENTGCSMFSTDGSSLAVDEDSPAVPLSADKPQGAYSCTLKEADQVLQLLWKAQPDEAASSPMPYTGHLARLLGGDPYLTLCTGPESKVVGVKLRVQEIKKLLNF